MKKKKLSYIYHNKFPKCMLFILPAYDGFFTSQINSFTNYCLKQQQWVFEHTLNCVLLKIHVNNMHWIHWWRKSTRIWYVLVQDKPQKDSNSKFIFGERSYKHLDMPGLVSALARILGFCKNVVGRLVMVVCMFGGVCQFCLLQITLSWVKGYI